MKVLYTTPSKPEADALVAFLADVSIDAAAVSRVDAYFATHSNFDIILRTEDDMPLAKSALEAFLAAPTSLTESLESQAAPDLSTLNPALAPQCPACDRILPLDASVSACPHCNEPVDIVDLIIAAHGPEAFAPAPDPVTRHACARCGYPRRGLPDPEVCPECGTRFPARP